MDDGAVEPHQPTHFVGGALPVLGGEGVGAQVGDAHLDGPLDDVEEGVLTTGVPLGSFEAALLGPPSVAVHDDGDMSGDELRR